MKNNILKITPEIKDLLKNYMKKDGHNLSTFNQQMLYQELEEAQVLPENELPEDVIKLNSKIKLEDQTTKKTLSIEIVPANDALPSKGKISVLSPFSIALIGYVKNSIIQWEMASNTKTFKVVEVKN